jgi:phosphoribosyl 1,2-cyclic phosphodiesterase
MLLRFTVLASGSSGNASFIEACGFGVLIDVGLGPRQLGWRMAAVGLSWERVDAVLLTHTHGDHWNHRSLAHLRRQRIPLYCHAEHQEALHSYCAEFSRLRSENLVHEYGPRCDWELAPSFRCRPLALAHDSGETFGFRFDAPCNGNGRCVSLAYVADLGSWDAELVDELTDVDLLAVEFNHDVDMECNSSRSPQLIARVLGDRGHLSNDQAAALLREVLGKSRPGRLRHVVQLHLSRECNEPELALRSARPILDEANIAIQLHTATQDAPGPILTLDDAGEETVVFAARTSVNPIPQSAPLPCQAWLPGWEG